MTSIAGALATRKAPRHIPATLAALQFANRSTERMQHLTPAEWRELLWWTDTRQVTLLLAEVCGAELPSVIREEVARKSERYALRFARLKRDLFEIADAFQAEKIEFVLLKGMSHAPAMTPEAQLRAQGDIDLWITMPSVDRAQEILRSLGYRSISSSKSRHLGPMARPNTWRWRGDLFDPEMPIAVELHYELWSDETEHIRAPGLEQFWERRIPRDFEGRSIHVLRDEDLLGFAALHFLLHVLHGDLPLQRAWEIARFLDTHADDTSFWDCWHDAHPAQLRRLETTVYDLVTRWFGCRWPKQLDDDRRDLAPDVQHWLEMFCLSPLTREWAPNKREVWLHLAFVEGLRSKSRVFLRRLAPLSLPNSAHRAALETNLIAKGRAFYKRLRFTLSRLVRHLVTLAPTLFDGVRFVVLRRL